MLKRVRIQQFQSLESVTLDLGRFTVIIGKSDVGKSAVIRAIKAAVTNQAGQAFIKAGAKSTGVGLLFDDTRVAWRKTATAVSASSEYKTATDTFTKIGREVPASIASLLRMGELTIAGERVFPTIHSQFHLPFLMGESPLSRARIIGEVTGINIIYAATREAQARERSAKQRLSTLAEKLDQVNLAIKGLGNLASIQQTLDRAKRSFKLAATASTEADSAASIVTDMAAATQRLAAAEARLIVLENASEAFNEYALESSIGALSSAEGILDLIIVNNDKISIANARILGIYDRLATLEKKKAMVKTCPLCGQHLAHSHGAPV
jgi:DNA repair ATPase RecN